MRSLRGPLHAACWATLLATSPVAAQDACRDDGAVRVSVEDEGDRPTADAIALLLAAAPSGARAWEVDLVGPRVIARHTASGERFARTLTPESNAYDRALATIELLNAARAAACTGAADDASSAPPPARRSEGAPPPRPATPTTTVALMAGVRFDADPDGPWMLRPALQVDLGLVRGGVAHLVLGVQASGFGVFSRTAEQPDLAVRYERHDVALEIGAALALDAITLSLRFSGGATVRDVTARDDDVARAHRLDVGATLGAVVALRVPLVGPLGLGLRGEVIGVPEPITYRVIGERVITESDVRLAASIGLDLEL